MTAVYIAPFAIEGETKLGGADYTSPEINIPINVDKTSVHFESDVDGTLHVQRAFDGTFKTIDSTPVTGGGVPNIISYAMRFPKIKIVFESTLAATFTAYVTIVYNGEG